MNLRAAWQAINFLLGLRMATKKLTFLYLSEQDIIKTGLTLSESIELCTYAFKEHGDKQVENPPKIAIHPLPDAFLHAMPGTKIDLLTDTLPGMTRYK